MVGGVERRDKGAATVLGGGGGGVAVKAAAVGDGEALRARAMRLMSMQDFAVLGLACVVIFAIGFSVSSTSLLELIDVAKAYRAQSKQMLMPFKEDKLVDELVGMDNGELERKMEKQRA
ncbi:hypothetical protein Syun_023801 [Stephania yunnanensis]|uniref:Uncharacterized protein n=1 Tax=Stephania yunnanensis TaxID=152371 RepID=A0AAP0I3N3_9MAGN